MNEDTANHENLHEQMEQAALLPSGDPRREAVVQRVRQADADTQAQWAAMLDENERLRLGAERVTPPEELGARLLEIPSQVSPSPVRTGSPWPLVVGSLAAACLGIVLILGWVLIETRAPGFEQAADEVVRLTINDHRQTPSLSLETGNPRTVAHHFAGQVHYPIRLPPMDNGRTLAGGRICSFDDRPLVYTRWKEREDGREHSLYQLCVKDFNLPEDFVPQHRIIPATPDHPESLKVTLWPAGDACAFVLVEPQYEDANQRLSYLP